MSEDNPTKLTRTSRSKSPGSGGLDYFTDRLRDFNIVYGQRDSDKRVPSLNEWDICQLRHKLMAEENDEYLEACMKDDMIGIADALADQLYILVGTILKHGMQDVMKDVFEEVHRSNMSKLSACIRDTDGDGRCEAKWCDQMHRKPIVREDGKIMKGPHYFKPNIEGVLNKLGYGKEDKSEGNPQVLPRDPGDKSGG
jgi:phosphoribosyl-ATP pyrophosphohydrolase